MNVEIKMSPTFPESPKCNNSSWQKPFPDIGDIRMFVLWPCVSRLAQGAVVRHRVQTPLQTSPRLVPTYQGRQPGHCLHRGNAHTHRYTEACLFQSLLSCEWKSMVPQVFWIRIPLQAAGCFTVSPPVYGIISSGWFEFTCRSSKLPGSNYTGSEVKCLLDCTRDRKRPKGKWWK